MTTPSEWEIWLARVMFEEGTGVKERPVLVIAPGIAYIISLKITSHPPRKWYAGEYQIQEWKGAGLHKESTIRVSQAFQLKPDDFSRKIGSLHPVDIAGVQPILSQLYG